MDKVLSYLHGMVPDSANGSLSNKRVITILCTIMLVAAFVANIMQGKHVDDNILNAIMSVIIGGMGMTGVEKFAPQITNQLKK